MNEMGQPLQQPPDQQRSESDKRCPTCGYEPIHGPYWFDKPQQPSVSAPSVLALAKNIARYLFTNGNGDKATRLVMMDEQPLRPPRNLGGWSEKAVADRIAKLLIGGVAALKQSRDGLRELMGFMGTPDGNYKKLLREKLEWVKERAALQAKLKEQEERIDAFTARE